MWKRCRGLELGWLLPGLGAGSAPLLARHTALSDTALGAVTFWGGSWPRCPRPSTVAFRGAALASSAHVQPLAQLLMLGTSTASQPSRAHVLYSAGFLLYGAESTALGGIQPVLPPPLWGGWRHGLKEGNRGLGTEVLGVWQDQLRPVLAAWCNTDSVVNKNRYKGRWW